jgi:hypothetical protein
MPSGEIFCPGQRSSEVNGASQRGLLCWVGDLGGVSSARLVLECQSDKEVPYRSRLVINPHPIVRDIRTEHDISQKIQIERLNDHQIVACESPVEGRCFKWRGRWPDISRSEIKGIAGKSGMIDRRDQSYL